MITSELKSLLEKCNIKFCEKYDLSKCSSFRIGGMAELAVFPKSRIELIEAIALMDDANVRCEIIGNASNVLFSDAGFDGAILFTGGVSDYCFDGTKLTCSCGASFTGMAKKAADMGLSGLEFAYGIPGTVGGAVYMNAGAYGSCVSDVLVSSLVYDRKTREVFKLTGEKHLFDYRRSIYMDNSSFICLGATFDLSEADSSEIYAKMDEYISSRKEKQPLEYPSAGSYFKRPEGYFAGKLIDDCRLKGFCVGGAAVSEKHAGFVINLGGATAADVLNLEEEVKKKVWETFGVELEREVRIIN